MRKQLLFIAAFIGIVFLISACTPTSNPAVLGSTPTVSISTECSSWGHYTFHVTYSPSDMTITKVKPGSEVKWFGCAAMKSGNFTCTGEVNPSVHLLSVQVCRTGPISLEETCENIPVATSRCPVYVFHPRLMNVTCIRTGQVGFEIDIGTSLSTHNVCCLGAQPCNEGTQQYACLPSTSHAGYLSCVGDPPTTMGSLNFGVSFASPYHGPSDLQFTTFPDFFTQAQTCISRLTPTAETVSNPPPPPLPPAQSCEDQNTSDSCKAFGGCYWWSSGGCYSYPEPLPPSCSDYSGVPDKCKDAGCYYWSDGTCSDSPEPQPCASYTDQPTCEANKCTWDLKTSSCY